MTPSFRTPGRALRPPREIVLDRPGPAPIPSGMRSRQETAFGATIVLHAFAACRWPCAIQACNSRTAMPMAHRVDHAPAFHQAAATRHHHSTINEVRPTDPAGDIKQCTISMRLSIKCAAPSPIISTFRWRRSQGQPYWRQILVQTASIPSRFCISLESLFDIEIEADQALEFHTVFDIASWIASPVPVC